MNVITRLPEASIPFPADITDKLESFLFWQAAKLPEEELRAMLVEFHASEHETRIGREPLEAFLDRVLTQARAFRTKVANRNPAQNARLLGT